MRPRFVSGCIALVAFALFGAEAGWAQQTGAIAGTVQRANDLQPLAGVQVSIPNTTLGTLTDAAGQFRLEEVPAGEHEVEFRLIGYGRVTRSVTVQAGQVTTVELELRERAIALDEIVITGTGTAGVERKRLGNTIATVTTEEIQNAPTLNVSEILAAREPGIQVLPASGLAGEGSKIRIRGAASVTQSNEPIIYLNGVRVTSGGGNFAGVASAGGAGVGSVSPLNTIDPSSIDRIEVLKGAAAATLYGTEASNGVIQIFTKTGRSGIPRWTFEVNGGVESMPTNRIIDNAGFARDQEQIDRISQRWGRSVGLYEMFSEPILPQADETGRFGNFAGQVSGGAPTVTYFASGRYAYHNGIYGFGELPDDFRGPEGERSDDRNEQINATSNVGIFPSDRVRVQISGYYTNTTQQAPQTANNIFGVWSSLIFSKPELAQPGGPLEPGNWFGSPAFATTREAAQNITKQALDHFGGSAQISLQPTETVTLTGTLGADILDNRSEEHLPFGYNVDGFATNNTEGFRGAATETSTTITAELRGSWDAEFGTDFTNSFTAGGQGFFQEVDTRGGSVTDFPAPGLETLSGGATQSTLETFGQNLNAGLFAQNQVGWRDFLFLTVGGRGDVNSTFGDEVDLAFYPKASVSIVLSDLPDWDVGPLSTLRLRGAYGESGLQPGDFDRFRTFVALPGPEGPGVAPDNLGSEELKPETTTEIEGGFELGLWEDRLAFNATYWHRTVSDMLVSKQFPPSGGFINRQVVNIGEMTGEGVDVGIQWRAVDEEDLSLSVFANGAYLQQEVTDMGGAPPVKTGGSYPRYRNFIREGYAPGAFFGAVLQDVPIPLDLAGSCTPPSESEALAYFSQPRNPSDFEVLPVACGTAAAIEQFIGKPMPNWQGSFGVNMSFLGNLELNTMFEYKMGDFWWQDLSGAFRRSNPVIGRNTPGSAEVTAIMENPNSTAQERLDAALEWATTYRALSPMSGLNQIYKADYLRWRELSLAYHVPGDIASRFGLSNVSLIARARNLALAVNGDYPGMSPELNQTAQCVSGDIDCNFLLGVEAWRMPIPRRFSLGVRASF